MEKCRDFIERRGLTNVEREFFSKCETCVQYSFKYMDCKVRGIDRSTSLVHGEIKRSRR